jgi:DNA-binding SARP family transcriptional activator
MLRLTLFGGFTLTGDDGAPLVIASRKCRALLAYLALEPRPVPRERLAGLFWGDGPEARARGSLRQALTTLRRELPGDGAWLDANAETVAIDRGVLSVDARDADELLRTAQASRALELSAAGELLGGLGEVAPAFDEWRDTERRRWREREATALRTLSEAARAAGHADKRLELARRLLKLEPWNEEAHRAVMESLAALGRHTEALRQYQLASEALRAELGIAPSRQTEQLMLEIRALRKTARPDVSPAPAASERAAAPSPAPLAPRAEPAGAPADSDVDPGVGAVVGREVESRQIEGVLAGCRASGRGHVILIRGEAGMGKTTLLRQTLAGASRAGFVTHLVNVGALGTGRNLDVVRGVLAALDADAAAAEVSTICRLPSWAGARSTPAPQRSPTRLIPRRARRRTQRRWSIS